MNLTRIISNTTKTKTYISARWVRSCIIQAFLKREERKYTVPRRKIVPSALTKMNVAEKNEDVRMVERHMHHEAREKQTKNIDTPEYRQAMRARQIWCEGNFSHQKERHNLRRTRKRGIEKVTEQCLLSACALNLKRLVAALKARTSANLKYWAFIRLVLSKRIFLLFQRFVNSANLTHTTLFLASCHLGARLWFLFRCWVVRINITFCERVQQIFFHFVQVITDCFNYR